MRLIFECSECGTHYLPPENLIWADGTRASAIWCSSCQTVMHTRGAIEPPEAVAAALLAARHRAEAPRDEEPAKPEVRPSRPARTRRARSGPGVGRHRLG